MEILKKDQACMLDSVKIDQFLKWMPPTSRARNAMTSLVTMVLGHLRTSFESQNMVLFEKLLKHLNVLMDVEIIQESYTSMNAFRGALLTGSNDLALILAKGKALRPPPDRAIELIMDAIDRRHYLIVDTLASISNIQVEDILEYVGLARMMDEGRGRRNVARLARWARVIIADLSLFDHARIIESVIQQLTRYTKQSPEAQTAFAREIESISEVFIDRMRTISHQDLLNLLEACLETGFHAAQWVEEFLWKTVIDATDVFLVFLRRGDDRMVEDILGDGRLVLDGEKIGAALSEVDCKEFIEDACSLADHLISLYDKNEVPHVREYFSGLALAILKVPRVKGTFKSISALRTVLYNGNDELIGAVIACPSIPISTTCARLEHLYWAARNSHVRWFEVLAKQTKVDEEDFYEIFDHWAKNYPHLLPHLLDHIPDLCTAYTHKTHLSILDDYLGVIAAHLEGIRVVSRSLPCPRMLAAFAEFYKMFLEKDPSKAQSKFKVTEALFKRIQEEATRKIKVLYMSSWNHLVSGDLKYASQLYLDFVRRTIRELQACTSSDSDEEDSFE